VSGVSSISKSEFDPNSDIDESITRITKSVFKYGIDIPLTVTQDDGTKSSYGEVSIPPGLVPIGWSVVISPVNQTDLDKPKPYSTSDSCGGGDRHESEEPEIRSIAFNMVILDDRGRQRPLQELLDKSKSGQGLGITLTYSMPQSQRMQLRDLKFIFLEEGDDSWRVSAEDIEITGNNGFGNISTTVNHLTSKKVIAALRN